jgi:hypothetical protein
MRATTLNVIFWIQEDVPKTQITTVWMTARMNVHQNTENDEMMAVQNETKTMTVSQMIRITATTQDATGWIQEDAHWILMVMGSMTVKTSARTSQVRDQIMGVQSRNRARSSVWELCS